MTLSPAPLARGFFRLSAGWVFLRYGMALASEALPAEFGTILFNVNPDAEIFVFTFGVSLAAGVLFGLAPAVESSRAAVSAARGSTIPARSRRIQDLLVAAQVALSLVLMIAGSMFIRGAVNSLRLETGYDSKHVVEVDLQFPEATQYTEARRKAVALELRARVAGLGGVADVTSGRPPGALGFRTAAIDPDNTTQPGRQSMLYYAYVQPNYFATVGIPLVLGRSFETRSGQAEHSVVMSESAARQLWPGGNPVGHKLQLGAIDERFHLPGDLAPGGAAYEVIGVARHVRGAELDQADSKEIYLPLTAEQGGTRPLLIRTSEATDVMRKLDGVISSLDSDLGANSSTLDRMLRQSPPFLASSLGAAIASTVGLFGLLLAAMGIYGTASYIAALRTREMGIRMAIGAPARAVLLLILRESIRPGAGGVVGGLLLATGASYGLRGLFYGLETVDILSFATVSVLFLTIALLAVYPPARRATRVDPIVALRQE